MMYRKPNVKSSRVKMKSSRVMNDGALREFKKKHPEHKDITLTKFNAIVKQFNVNIVDEVISNKNGISLPELIGQILIISFPKSKKKAVDFGASNKSGVLTYHRNWDTEDRLGKIVYYSGRYSIRYSYLWGFTPARGFKNKMSEVYRKLWAKYIYVDNKSVSINSVLK
tara:strand:+ start:1736 stop:2239 length:504 start_codon:yes stop_codon:yes gene_type:complete